jgi:hypothetical protein
MIRALIRFTASIYEFRALWIRVLIWLCLLPPLVARWSGNGRVFSDSLGVLCLAAIPLAAFGWWRNPSKFDRRQVLLVAALCTALLIFSSSYVSWGLLPSSRLLLGLVSIALNQLSILILAIPISWELLTRLRDDSLESERLKGEMQAARLVQQFFVAERPGHIDVVYEPAHEVGGDFAFTFPMPDGSQLIATGDVSGKGLKAAMTVSLIAGALRNRRSSEPAEVLAELNGALLGGLGFVTAIVVRCDATGALRMACAGHPAPYLAGRECEVEAGLPLGITADASYAERTAALEAGQQLTLVSDGVVEAENAQRELFGFDRTREISTKSAREIAEAARAWGQNDDITVVTVRRNKPQD